MIVYYGMVNGIYGVYVDTFLTDQGCDSIELLFLTVNYSSFTTDSMIAVIVPFGMVMCMTAAVYVDTLQTIAGCDSIVTMDLTVNYVTVGYDSITM